MATRSATAPLSRPGIYLVRMLVFLTLVGFLAFVLFRQITPAFLANAGLNGLILGVLLIAILLAFGQVIRLFREVAYVNAVAAGEGSAKPPSLLAPLSPAILARREGTTQAGVRSYLDTVAARLDEGREILRYVAGLLILLGLLGTFWGLIDTLGAVGSVIQSMRGGGEASAMFDELKSGLAKTAFRHRPRLLGLAVRPRELAHHRLPRPTGRPGSRPLPQRAGGLAGLW